MSKRLNAEHGILCRLPGERVGYFGWPSVARLANGSLFTVCYPKAAAGEKCALLWSRWMLPK